MSFTTGKSFERPDYAGFKVHNDVNTMFGDLYSSAMGKAVRVSPSVQGVTLGPNAVLLQCEEPPLEDPLLLCTPPPISSTPKKKSNNLGRGHVLRRPNKPPSSYYEIRSPDDVQPKLLMAELTKKQMQDSDKAVLELESVVKENEKQVLEQLSRVYLTTKSEQEAQNSIVEKTLLQDVLVPKETVVADAEKDKIADSKAYERSEKVKQHVEEAKKKSAALLEKKKLYELMSLWQMNYTTEYRKVVEVIRGSQDPRALQQAIAHHLKNLNNDVAVTDSLQMKIKNDELSQQDLKTADIVMKNLRAVLNAAKVEAKKIEDLMKEKEIKMRNTDKEKVPKETSSKTSAEESQENQSVERNTLSDCFDAQSLQTFARLRQHLSQVQQTLQPVLNDPAMNMYRFELQKAVTLPVNAISPVSSEHMMDKYRKLHNLLAGKRAEVSGGVSASDHPLGGILVKDLMAKLFVRQGELTVSSKPEAAFALASILVNLWTDFPDFGEIVMARFQWQCPYLAPVFLPQLEGQSDQDYYRSLGYLTQNGEIEKQDMFLKRMKGLMRLYAAILITKPRNANKANPLGLKEAWRWLTAILNIEPRPDICAVLILELLEVVGNDFLTAYRGQAKKLLAYICKEYFPRLDKVTASSTRGPLTRLETFLEKTAKEATIPPPAQRLPHNFW